MSASPSTHKPVLPLVSRRKRKAADVITSVVVVSDDEQANKDAADERPGVDESIADALRQARIWNNQREKKKKEARSGNALRSSGNALSASSSSGNALSASSGSGNALSASSGNALFTGNSSISGNASSSGAAPSSGDSGNALRHS